MNELVISTVKQNLFFYCFIDLHPFSKNAEGVTLGHKLIVNFM